jgi:hypothetical protein
LQFSGIGPVDGAALRIRLPAKTVTTAKATTPAMKRLERMALFSFTVCRILLATLFDNKKGDVGSDPLAPSAPFSSLHRNALFQFFEPVQSYVNLLV